MIFFPNFSELFLNFLITHTGCTFLFPCLNLAGNLIFFFCFEKGTEHGLDRGEASSSSAMTSLSDVTPVLPKREPRAGVGAEESSDDEMGSQISARSHHKEISSASSSISNASSRNQMYHGAPTSLNNLGG